jgi:1-aminocyclopropane-1-carboxylate deaminase/D-cysteine desulfhydrase-like pyridoxal-dependent ACC family enzyme
VLEGEFDRCRIIARETGILLDPIYTLAAWDAIEQRKAKHRKNCLLVHTGGGLNLFGIVNRYNIRFGGGPTDR